MKHVLITIIAVGAVASCGKSGDKKVAPEDKPAPTQPAPPPPTQKDEPAEPKPPAKPPQNQATVDITLSGAVEKMFSGAIGTCQIPVIGGKAAGATYQVRDGDVELAILATSDDEIKAPKIVVNVSGANHASYALYKTATTAKLDPGKSAEVEADLSRIGKKETVHVKGTITCPPR